MAGGYNNWQRPPRAPAYDGFKRHLETGEMTNELIVARINLLLSNMEDNKKYYCSSWGAQRAGDNNFDKGTIIAWLHNIQREGMRGVAYNYRVFDVMNEIWRQVTQ